MSDRVRTAKEQQEHIDAIQPIEELGGESTKLYKTAILGMGPFCVEFPDGEIILTRSEGRQKLIAMAQELLEALVEAASALDVGASYIPATSPAEAIRFNASNKALAAIARAEGRGGHHA